MPHPLFMPTSFPALNSMSDASGAIAHGVAPRAPPPGSTDVLTLTVGNQTLTGWQRISVTRPLAAIPASFSIELTEKYPNAADTPVQAGQPCTVKIGADLVLTGYVDRYTSSVSAAQHTIRIEGRSMSEDLVDCSAIVENTSAGSTSKQGLQILNGDAISIAKKLAKPYGVDACGPSFLKRASLKRLAAVQHQPGRNGLGVSSTGSLGATRN